MITPSVEETQSIDEELIDEVVRRIPDWTWESVRDAIIANLVDNMPSDIIQLITGEPDDFDTAEAVLYDYYPLPQQRRQMIIDAFKIIGDENTLYLLDSLQLDKIQPPSDEVP